MTTVKVSKAELIRQYDSQNPGQKANDVADALNKKHAGLSFKPGDVHSARLTAKNRDSGAAKATTRRERKSTAPAQATQPAAQATTAVATAEKRPAATIADQDVFRQVMQVNQFVSAVGGIDAAKKLIATYEAASAG